MREPLAEEFFNAAITVNTERGKLKGEPKLQVKIFNNSDVPFKIQATGNFILEKYPLGQITLTPHEETILSLRGMWNYPKEIDMDVNVTDILVTPDESLHTHVVLQTDK